MKPILEPWQKVTLSPEAQQRLFRDCGRFQAIKDPEKALPNFDKALELKTDDLEALLSRSRCKRELTQPEKALADCTAALEYDVMGPQSQIEVCDTLYEMNQLEKCKVDLHDNLNKFGGNKQKHFIKRMQVIDRNLKDSLGDTLSPFILENEKTFDAAAKQMKAKNNPETRPLWKVQREQNKCDVLSLPDTDDDLVSPREEARRERSSRICYQMYFRRGWADVTFLKKLCSNKNLLLPQATGSTPILRKLANTGYNTARKNLKMLQARSPIYNELAVRFPSAKLRAEQLNARLKHVQYQTHRNMTTILRTLKRLREMGNIERLCKYVEEVMGDYVVLKTHRIMPWKYEFVNEVYNILALAHADRMVIPKNLRNIRPERRLKMLLRVPIDKVKDPVPFVFGDRSTFQEPNKYDPSLAAHKRFIARLERRMFFAKYCIEKSYLQHEVARKHLERHHIDDCLRAARRAVEEARICGSTLWEFLGIVLILKAQLLMGRIESISEIVQDAKKVAQRLKSADLLAFIEHCAELNEQQMEQVKRNQSIEMRKKRARRFSLASGISSLVTSSNNLSAPSFESSVWK